MTTKDDANNAGGMLLGTANKQISYSTIPSTDDSGSDVIGTPLDEAEEEEGEISKPWPATFERSAEILAQPIVGRDLVVKATESMHILSPTKLRKNVSYYVCG